ncbi:alpha/beta hydrolase [Luteipulveratus mongoliensis]|uniref:AB hydrolase-1 domain-containing protein n=1 Tax=Luteipulveratus mongoliensis TaxID=571913 RepID=A0A0K1JFY6_9MICO|nr:alpha/beta hydrolase [Luteipulveratus mongoliensis]AKU15498.1 hypothetical protein VV02_05840 [Luteipulveratus mongoliensis]
MTAIPATLPRRADRYPRPVRLDAGEATLSGVVAEPVDQPLRGLIVAIHGAGMDARYFDAPSAAEASLLGLAPRLGFAALAIDRPGHGATSGGQFVDRSIEGQAHALGQAISAYRERADIGAGVCLLGHSFGGKVAVTLAYQGDADLVGLDISGCGFHYRGGTLQHLDGRRMSRLGWGPPSYYPEGTFTAMRGATSDFDAGEVAQAQDWPYAFERVAAQVRVPVRMTFAEREPWWRSDSDELAAIERAFVRAPSVEISTQPYAGHNLSLGLAARSYHLAAVAFFERCLLARQLHRTRP